MTSNNFTITDKLECAEREVRQRQRVYPRRVSKRLMSKEFAARELALMEAIAADYRELASKERLL